jgi:hypothetical protein
MDDALDMSARPITTDVPRKVRDLVVPALLSTVLVAVLLVVLTVRNGDGLETLMTPGVKGSAASVVLRDFPHASLAADAGHDGQQFYVIARQPMHLRAAAAGLDRPRYREQRILLPVLGWMTAPTGGGAALVLALYFWSAVGVFLVGLGGGALVRLLGGSDSAARRSALLLPLVPGVLASLALLGPDALALGLVLLAIGCDLRGRRAWALALGVLAVLAKEPVLLVLAGWVLARGRRSLPLVLGPAIAAAGWWLFLRAAIPARGDEIKEFEPVVGVGRAISHWVSTRQDLAAAAIVLAAVVLGVCALAQRASSPLRPAIALQLLFMLLLGPDVIGLNWNATRAVAPLTVLAIVALASGQPTSRSSRLSS